ncbi:MAG: fibronectin type III domain-containing protein, partial [Erysipelotrichaceae bacterium]|nr:fibronectin type III domain-containing protein [Erysipelotrichaceae bacterium]
GADIRWKVDETVEEYIIMRKEGGEWKEIETIKASKLNKAGGNYQYYDEEIALRYGKGFIYSVAVKGNDGALVYDDLGLALYRLNKPVIVSAMKLSDTSAQVFWNSQDAHGYELQYSTDNGANWNKLPETKETSLVVNDIDTDGQLVFRLRAQKTNADRGVTWSQYSDWVKLGTLARPQLVAIYNSSKGIGVHFKPVSSASSYILMKKENGSWTKVKEFALEEIASENGRLIVYDETVKESYGKGFIYSVSAKNDTAESAYDTRGLAIYRLEAPKILSALIKGTSAVITLEKADAHGYEVQYSADGGKTWTKADETADTTVTVEGLNKADTYVFRARCEKTNADRGTTWSAYSAYRTGVAETNALNR